MTLKAKKKVKQIKNVLSSQRFYDFYKEGGEYDQYIANRIYAREEQDTKINEKIAELFAEVIK